MDVNSPDVKNFSFLNELIQKGEKRIVLESDFIIDDAEKEIFRDGIIIDHELIIEGNGHTIDARNSSRIFNVHWASVTIKNLTFRDAYSPANGGAIVNKGILKIEDSTFTDCIADGFYGGSAIYNWDGFLVIDRCTFTYNLAFGDFGGAGAVANFGNAVIMDSKFIENKSVGDYGGGAIISTRSLKVTGSEFIKNHAEYAGGAIVGDGGEITLDDCDFSHNSASRGGAIHLKDSQFIKTRCRFTSNSPENISTK